MRYYSRHQFGYDLALASGGIRICASTESSEAKLYGSLNENSSERVVEEKRWSISLAVTAERNIT